MLSESAQSSSTARPVVETRCRSDDERIETSKPFKSLEAANAFMAAQPYDHDFIYVIEYLNS